MRPSKFKMDGENRYRLKSKNKILPVFNEEETYIELNELIVLHYSSAVILIGKQKAYAD